MTDRLQLGTDLMASCGKLLYAFLWQVDADISDGDADIDANEQKSYGQNPQSSI